MKDRILDINDDIKHEQLKWRIERISWIFLLLVIAAAIAGFLGSGPYSSKTLQNKTFTIKYSKIDRYDSQTRIEITTHFIPKKEFSIWINHEFIGDILELTIHPEPKSNFMENNNLIFVFDANESNLVPISIAFEFKHSKSGAKKLTVGIEKDFIETTQMILP